jgi:cardiolipin synthase
MNILMGLKLFIIEFQTICRWEEEIKLMNFSKREFLSIPNILCYLRLLFIPIFVVLYIKAEKPDEYLQAAFVVMIACLTDFFDGFIARNYNMVTEFGKFIDPVADKLMQAALMFVLIIKIKGMFLLIILFVIKESFMAIAGFAMYRRGKKLDGAKWFGKVSTTVLYIVMLVLIAIPSLETTIDNIMMLTCAAFLTLSFVLYIAEYIKMYREIA